MTRWPHGDPARVVHDVLAQPAYRALAPTTAVAPKPSPFEALGTWIGHVLSAIFRPLGHVLDATHAAGTAVGIALVVIALGVFAFLAFRLILAFARPARNVAADRGATTALGERPSSSAWRARARDAAERGDFGAAIAGLFAAALGALDERALVAFDAARTPGEYRRQVRRVRSEAATAFDELAERFVRAAYAPGVAEASDFAAAERAYAAFEPVVRR